MALSWMHLALTLLVIATLVLVVALVLHRWRRAGISRMIGFTLWLSAVYAGLSLVVAIVTVISVMSSAQVAITVPVTSFWPKLPPGTEIEGPTASVAYGGFVRAELGVEGLDAPTRALWASGQALSFLVPGAIAGLIALACFQLLRGAAFAPVVARAATITAVVVLVGGIAAAGLSDLAGSMAAQQVLTLHGATIPHVPDGADPLANWPAAASGGTIPLWPIGAGLGLAALAAVFRYGSRLQRDTEGLV